MNQMSKPFVTILVLAGVAIVGGCQRKQSSQPNSDKVIEDHSTIAFKDAKAVAIQAKEALFARLSGRLMEIMQSEGPAAAIQVCSQEASGIAKSVGDEHGVSIGRTALKLRNPKNVPPEWAKMLLDKGTTEPEFVSLPDGHTGALLPIKLQATCVVCHGPADEIAEPLRSKLAELYPNDAATGFKEGDLRGWFWVDVPPGSKSKATVIPTR